MSFLFFKSSGSNSLMLKWVAFFALASTLCLGSVVFFRSAPAKPVAPPWEKVELHQGAFNVTIPAAMRVGAQHRWAIKAPQSGRIDHLLVGIGDRFKKGQVIAWMSSTERARLLDTVQGQESKFIKQWSYQQEAVPIVAPWDGIVIERPVRNGQKVSQKNTLFVFTNKLRLETQVEAADISNIRKTRWAWVSLDKSQTKRFTAKIFKIYDVPRLAHGRWVYDVLLEPINAVKSLNPGMTGTAAFIVHHKANSSTIPNWLAGGVENSKVKVYIEDLYGDAKEREIFVGKSDGHSVEILSPVERGTTFLYRPGNYSEMTSEVSADIFSLGE